MISETMSCKDPALEEKWLLKRKKTKEEKQEAERKIFNTREEVKKSRKEIQNHHQKHEDEAKDEGTDEKEEKSHK